VEIEDIQRLHVVARPFADETLNGLIGRHAMLNHWPRFGWIFQYSGYPLPQRRHLDTAIEKLSKLFGLPFGELAALQPGRPLADFQHRLCEYKGRLIPDGYYAKSVRRVCPLCLVDSSHHRDIWDYQFVRVCPVHSVRLLDHCTCGKKLDWVTHAFHRCKQISSDGKPICIDLRTVEAPKVPRGQYAGQTVILSLMGGAAETIPPLLQGLDVAMALNDMLVIGDYALRSELDGERRWRAFGVEQPELRYLDDGTGRGPEIALTVGYQVLQSSTDEFRDLLAVWRHRIGLSALASLGSLQVMQAHQRGVETLLSGEIARGIRLSKLSPVAESGGPGEG
jgi:hypothetical protein